MQVKKKLEKAASIGLDLLTDFLARVKEGHDITDDGRMAAWAKRREGKPHLAELIKAANERFHQMDPVQRRKAIAQEAIDQALLGTFDPKREVYVYLDGVSVTGELLESIAFAQLECTVCAIGGGAVAALRLFDRHEDVIGPDELVFGKAAYSLLKMYFEPEELGLIEAMFETNRMYALDRDADHEMSRQAERWLAEDAAPSDLYAFVMIWDNVYVNGGPNPAVPPRRDAVAQWRARLGYG